MKRFFKTATLFVGILLAVCLVVHYAVIPRLNLTPYYWGDKLIIEKRNAIVTPPYPDVIFFGSSMVYRQINPEVFDAVVEEKTGNPIRSFNFGVNWLASSEMIYLAENYVREAPVKPRYLFLELQRIKMVNYKNYLTTRIIYWYTPEMYAFTTAAIVNSKLPFYSKAGQWISHTVNFSGNQINLGYFTEALRYQSEIQKAGFFRTDTDVGNGFLSLETENRQMLEAGINPERLNRFLKDTSAVTARMHASLTAFTYYEKNPDELKHFNKAYSARLHALINNCIRQNIHLIILLPPRLDRLQYQELLPVFNSLPAGHRINMADARQYPEFYFADYSFDVTHMNEKGAEIYSRKLAENFSVLIQPTQKASHTSP